MVLQPFLASHIDDTCAVIESWVSKFYWSSIVTLFCAIITTISILFGIDMYLRVCCFDRWLQERGISPTKINQVLNRGNEDEDYNLESGDECDLDTLVHNDERTWFREHCDRVVAESLLAGKRDGTFLVRKSSTQKYALSVACNGITNHCIIDETKQGWGFAEPYNIYPTLKDLVLHYATNSLEIHNDSLNTVLAYPLFANNYGCGDERYVALGTNAYNS